MQVWLLLLLAATYCHAEISINYVTVLLPSNVVQPGSLARTWEFPVEARGGCFLWLPQATPRPIIEFRVDPQSTCTTADGKKGHTRVFITPKATPNTDPEALIRKTTHLVAADIATGEEVLCDIFVDLVKRLDVLTSTRVVHVGEKESVDLQGFDSNNNVFSALTSLSFEWINSGEHHLSRIRFADAGLDVADFYQESDKHGLGTTDRLPVKGMQPGLVNLTARLTDSFQPASTTVTMAVRARLCLTPIVVYLAPLSEMTCILKTITKDKPTIRGDSDEQLDDEAAESAATFNTQVFKDSCGSKFTQTIGMPNAQYTWTSDNTTVTTVDKDSGLIRGLAVGLSHVEVTDVYLPQLDKPEPQNRASVWVAEPHHLELVLAQDPEPRCDGKEEWVVTKDRHTVLQVRVLTENGYPMVVNNMEFQLDFEGSSIVATQPHTLRLGESLNTLFLPGDRLSISSVQLGLTRVTASLDKIVAGDQVHTLPAPLTASLVISVTPNIRISLREVVLASGAKPVTFILKSTGGSGLADWESSDPSVVTVEPASPSEGLLTGLKGGFVTLTVRDRCNPLNTDNITVWVSKPAKPHFLPSAAETQLGESLALAVGVVDDLGRRFSDCSSLHLETSFRADSSMFTITSPEDTKCHSPCPWQADKSCWLLEVKALAPGFAELKANIRGAPEGAGTSKVLAGFEPLDIAPSQILLAVGSTVSVHWSHGPLPWPTAGFQTAANSVGVPLPPAGVVPSGSTTLGAATVPLEPNSWATVLGDSGHARLSVFPYSSESDYSTPGGGMGKSGGLAAVSYSARSPNVFNVTCNGLTFQRPLTLRLRVGNTPSTFNPQPLVAEALIRLACYPALRLRPRRLLLGVNARKPVTAAIQVVGDEDDEEEAILHPLHHLVKYTMADTSVAQVDEHGMVTGLVLGDTALSGHVEHPELGPLLGNGLNDAVLVTVHFKNFVIAAPTQHILPKRQTFIHLRGINGEVPGDAAFDSVSCLWQSDSSELELFPPLSSPSTSGRASVSGPSVGLVARRSGRVRVRAVITVRQPSGSNMTTASFEQWMTVSVLEPLVLRSRRFLLLPPGAASIVQTSLDDSSEELTYHILNPSDSMSGDRFVSPIQVSARGIIRAMHQPTASTGDLEGDAVLLVRAPGHAKKNPISAPSESPSYPQLSQTVQTQIVHVSVRAVRQIAVRSLNAEDTSSSLVGPMCAGENITLAVVLRDALSRTFDSLGGWQSESSSLKIVSSRPEVIRARTAVLRTEGVGAASADYPDNDLGPDMNHKGVLSLITLSALGLEDGQQAGSAVVKVWLSDQDNIIPLHLHVTVADDAACREPTPVSVAVRFKPSSSLRNLDQEASLWGSGSGGARAEWLEGFTVDVCQALKIPRERLVVSRVVPTLAVVEFYLIPAHLLSSPRAFHPDQWHLAPSVGANVQDLVKELLKQLGDEHSSLLTSPITRHLLSMRPGYAPKVRPLDAREPLPSTDNVWETLGDEAPASSAPPSSAPVPPFPHTAADMTTEEPPYDWTAVATPVATAVAIVISVLLASSFCPCAKRAPPPLAGPYSETPGGDADDNHAFYETPSAMVSFG